MITCEWRDSWEDDPEVADMLKAAAAFDAEQGFSASMPPLGDFGSQDGRTSRELVAWLSREVGPVTAHTRRVPAAFLRVTVNRAATGVLELTVEPEFRSLGIGTLLVETLGCDTDQSRGWAGTGAQRLLAWARGSHPAAERMAMRFGATPERLVWRIIRPLDGRNPFPPADQSQDLRVEPMQPASDAESVARFALGAGVTFDRRLSNVLVARDRDGGVVGFVDVGASRFDGTVDHGLGAVGSLVVAPSVDRARVTEALLVGALRRLSNAGVRQVEMLVDTSRDDLIPRCLAMGFYHDQTEVCYRIPLHPSEHFTKLQP